MYKLNFKPFSAIVFIYNKDNNKFLSVTRKDNGKYSVPGGKLEESESSSDALTRELFEETNLRVRSKELSFILQCIDDHLHLTTSYFMIYNESIHGHPSSMEANGIVSWVSKDNLLDSTLCEFPELNRSCFEVIISKF